MGIIYITLIEVPWDELSLSGWPHQVLYLISLIYIPPACPSLHSFFNLCSAVYYTNTLRPIIATEATGKGHLEMWTWAVRDGTSNHPTGRRLKTQTLSHRHKECSSVPLTSLSCSASFQLVERHSVSTKGENTNFSRVGRLCCCCLRGATVACRPQIWIPPATMLSWLRLTLTFTAMGMKEKSSDQDLRIYRE